MTEVDPSAPRPGSETAGWYRRPLGVARAPYPPRPAYPALSAGSRHGSSRPAYPRAGSVPPVYTPSARYPFPAAQHAEAAAGVLARPAGDPGRALGIAGFVLSLLASVVGLVISILALARSRRAGRSNRFAVAGIVVGAATSAIWIAVLVVLSAESLGLLVPAALGGTVAGPG